jgi:hypothetical protein
MTPDKNDAFQMKLAEILEAAAKDWQSQPRNIISNVANV